MPLTVPAEGENYLLKLLVQAPLAVADDWVLHLYRNDETIGYDTTLADLEEATATGYAPIELPRDQWGDPTQVSERAVSAFDPSPVWFTVTSGTEDIYGWYVTNAAEDTLLFGDRLPGAPVTISTSNPIPIAPTMRLTREYPPIQ